jgi:hypothetical protein
MLNDGFNNGAGVHKLATRLLMADSSCHDCLKSTYSGVSQIFLNQDRDYNEQSMKTLGSPYTFCETALLSLH